MEKLEERIQKKDKRELDRYGIAKMDKSQLTKEKPIWVRMDTPQEQKIQDIYTKKKVKYIYGVSEDEIK